jgi:hypothetical protein
MPSHQSSTAAMLLRQHLLGTAHLHLRYQRHAASTKLMYALIASGTWSRIQDSFIRWFTLLL